MATKRSEGQAWDGVEELGSSLLASKDGWVRNIGRELMATAAEMRGQLKKGFHTNPLVVYGNPRQGPSAKQVISGFDPVTVRLVRLMSDRVYMVRYQHMDDHQDYQHDFSAGVNMWAVEKGKFRHILLTQQSGRPLWDDFD